MKHILNLKFCLS